MLMALMMVICEENDDRISLRKWLMLRLLNVSPSSACQKDSRCGKDPKHDAEHDAAKTPSMPKDPKHAYSCTMRNFSCT